MIVTFKTEAYANITMFGDVAVKLLKIMGHSGTIPGALLAEDVPGALERLQKTVDSLKATAKGEPAQSDPDKDWRDQDVSLATRALPLIELLQAARKQECNVMWD